jgi:hypothetical protein
VPSVRKHSEELKLRIIRLFGDACGLEYVRTINQYEWSSSIDGSRWRMW